MTRFRCARCDWQSENDGDVFAHTQPADQGGAGHPRCVLCRLSLTPTEQQSCGKCLGRVRADLRDIADLYALLPAALGHLGSNAPRRDARSHGDGSERLPGGDALVMLAGGSEGALWAAPNPVKYPTVNDNRPDQDPQSVVFALGEWERAWREDRHEPPPRTMVVASGMVVGSAPAPVTVTSAVRYLSEERCEWASRWHPAFDEFASDMARIRAALVRATGKSTAPETREARCINLDCSGCDTVKLERGYGDEGRADYWSCPRCRREYTQHGYHLALASTLARRGVVA